MSDNYKPLINGIQGIVDDCERLWQQHADIQRQAAAVLDEAAQRYEQVLSQITKYFTSPTRDKIQVIPVFNGAHIVAFDVTYNEVLADTKIKLAERTTRVTL